MRETLIEAWQLISLLTEKLVNFISQITNPLAHLVENVSKTARRGKPLSASL